MTPDLTPELFALVAAFLAEPLIVVLFLATIMGGCDD